MRIAIILLALAVTIPIGCNGSSPTQSEQDDKSTAPSDAADKTSAEDPVTQEDVRQEAQETLETAQELVAQEHEAYRKQVSERLDKIQGHFDALKEQLAKSAPSAGVSELQETFEGLEQQLADARKKADQETAETREAWEQLKSAVDDAVSQLEASTEDARKRLEAEKDQQEKDQQEKDQQEKDQQEKDQNQSSEDGGAENEKEAKDGGADATKKEPSSETSGDDTK